jgi:RNA polymerase sigma factor for flagellar operon FliA
MREMVTGLPGKAAPQPVFVAMKESSMGTTPSPDVHEVQRCRTDHVESLIQEYAPLIKYIAQRLAYRLPASVCLEDLISAGVLGLMDAIEKYDPTRGTTFKTYAELRIRGAMIDDLRQLDWVPRSVRQKEHALTKAYAEIERRQRRPAEDEEVAALLALDLDEFYDWLTQVRGVSLLRLDMPLEPAPKGNPINYLDTLLVDAAPGPLQIAETQNLKMHIAEAIEQLPLREKVVISLYYYEELTMQEIGKVLELTLSRISQLHTKAILHLRAALQSPQQDQYAAVG